MYYKTPQLSSGGMRPDSCGENYFFYILEALIKSGMQIAQTDFSSGGCRPQDCMKMTQEYLMYFKEFSCNMAENM